MRRLRAWLALLLVAACCWLSAPVARAQSTAAQPAAGAEGSEESPAVPQHAIAFLSSALVLVIVCAPSRKG